MLAAEPPLPHPPEPVAVFLKGGCDLHAATCTVAYGNGAYACSRQAEDPLQAMIEAALPPGPARDALTDATEDRLRACWQRAFLANHGPEVAARAAQTRRNVQRLVCVEEEGSAGADCSVLETSLVGILEAAGAVSSSMFTAAQARAVAAVLARLCSSAATAAEFDSSLAEMAPGVLAKLKKIGFCVPL